MPYGKKAMRNGKARKKAGPGRRRGRGRIKEAGNGRPLKEGIMMMYLPSVFGDNLMDDFFDDFDRSFFRPARPAVRAERSNLMRTDIKETETGYELDVELPGYKKEDLNLELNAGYLNISAAKDTTNEEKDTEGRVIRRERYTGSMSRSFYVGDDITEEDIKARFEDGILKLCVPKKEVEEKIPEKKTIAIEG